MRLNCQTQSVIYRQMQFLYFIRLFFRHGDHGISELPATAVFAAGKQDRADFFRSGGNEQNPTNTTRFAVFSRIASKRHSREMGMHSILLFTVRNEAGALARAVDVIGSHGFNMRTLRSRPMKELLWQYYFYVEAEGDVQTEEGRLMMEELGEFCDRLKFAGTYVKRVSDGK